MIRLLFECCRFSVSPWRARIIVYVLMQASCTACQRPRKDALVEALTVISPDIRVTAD